MLWKKDQSVEATSLVSCHSLYISFTFCLTCVPHGGELILIARLSYNLLFKL
jgi:hypothetical protein